MSHGTKSLALSPDAGWPHSGSHQDEEGMRLLKPRGGMSVTIEVDIFGGEE